MSRLSDILGVKEGQEFRFNGDSRYRIMGDRREVYIDDKWYTSCSEQNLCEMIAHSNFIKIIPEKITLTEQQITAIRGRIAEGTPWVAKRKNESTVWFCKKEPKSFEMPFDAGTACTPLYDFITFKNSPIYLPDLIKE